MTIPKRHQDLLKCNIPLPSFSGVLCWLPFLHKKKFKRKCHVLFQDHADLASVDDLDEHRFIVDHLNFIDPQHRRWYISTRQEDQNRWVNLGDGTQMLNLQQYFLRPEEWGESSFTDYKKDYLVYSFSYAESRWGFQPVFGHEEYLYICEMPIEVRRAILSLKKMKNYQSFPCIFLGSYVSHDG